MVYNVLKSFMEMNSKQFDELTATYKLERQKDKKREKEREDVRVCVAILVWRTLARASVFSLSPSQRSRVQQVQLYISFLLAKRRHQ